MSARENAVMAATLLMTALLATPEALAQQVGDGNKIGRYTVTPVFGGAIEVDGTPHYFAWRLDTATGDLQVCVYDPGGWKRPGIPGGVVSEKLTCTPAASANGNNGKASSLSSTTSPMSAAQGP
jgi:hypothetical protein